MGPSLLTPLSQSLSSAQASLPSSVALSESQTSSQTSIDTFAPANRFSDLLSGQRSLLLPVLGIAVYAGLRYAAGFDEHPSTAMAALTPLFSPGLMARLNALLVRAYVAVEEMARDAYWTLIGPVDPFKHEFWRMGKFLNMEDLLDCMPGADRYSLVLHRLKHRTAEERLARTYVVMTCFFKSRYRANPTAYLSLDSVSGHIQSALSVAERRAIIVTLAEEHGLHKLPLPLLTAMTRGFLPADVDALVSILSERKRLRKLSPDILRLFQSIRDRSIR